jgi:hypothetical protein
MPDFMELLNKAVIILTRQDKVLSIDKKWIIFKYSEVAPIFWFGNNVYNPKEVFGSQESFEALCHQYNINLNIEEFQKGLLKTILENS